MCYIFEGITSMYPLAAISAYLEIVCLVVVCVFVCVYWICLFFFCLTVGSSHWTKGSIAEVLTVQWYNVGCTGERLTNLVLLACALPTSFCWLVCWKFGEYVWRFHFIISMAVGWCVVCLTPFERHPRILAKVKKLYDELDAVGEQLSTESTSGIVDGFTEE